MPGHPDGQNYPVWQGTPNFQAGAVVTSVAPLVMDATVTNFASLHIRITNVTGAITATFTDYADQAKTKVAFSCFWIIVTNTVLDVTFPSVAGFAELVMTTGQAGNQTADVLLQPTNVSEPKRVYTLGGFSQFVNFQNVAAGADFFDTMHFIMQGSGYLFLAPSDASGKLQFTLFDRSEAGAPQGTIYFNPGSAGVIGPIPVMQDVFPVVLQVHNTDGVGGHTFSYRYQVNSN